MLLKLGAWLTALKADRGEGPVPYVIIVSLMAAAAAGVALAITGIANDWVQDIKKP